MGRTSSSEPTPQTTPIIRRQELIAIEEKLAADAEKSERLFEESQQGILKSNKNQVESEDEVVVVCVTTEHGLVEAELQENVSEFEKVEETNSEKVEETVTKTVEEIVSETVEETISEKVEEIVSEKAEETVPESEVEEIVSETVEETIADKLEEESEIVEKSLVEAEEVAAVHLVPALEVLPESVVENVSEELANQRIDINNQLSK